MVFVSCVSKVTQSYVCLQIFDILHKVNVTMSYTTILEHLKEVARSVREQVAQVLSERREVIFVWDNINWYRHVSQSRINNAGEMVNATTRTLVIARHTD